MDPKQKGVHVYCDSIFFPNLTEPINRENQPRVSYLYEKCVCAEKKFLLDISWSDINNLHVADQLVFSFVNFIHVFMHLQCSSLITYLFITQIWL